LEPPAVGAQHVGQHVSVERVVLVAGRPVPAAEVLQLVRSDHHHPQTRLEQGIDDRAVGPFDRHLQDSRPMQPGYQMAQSRRGVSDSEPLELDTTGIDHGDGVFGAGPVNARGRSRVPGHLMLVSLIDHGVVLPRCCLSRWHPQRFGTRLPVAH
jgi:hypothetical protein